MAVYRLTVLLIASTLVLGDKQEEPSAILQFLNDINDKFQNATHAVEGILGVDIPSTQAEVKTALEDNLNKLKSNAEHLQKKLGEYSSSGNTTLTGLLQQVQTQVNQTIEDLGKRNPETGKLLEQIKTGYNDLLGVSKRMQEVVEQQAGSASQDLKGLAQQARSELQRATTQLEAKIHDLVADKSKTS